MDVLLKCQSILESHSSILGNSLTFLRAICTKQDGQINVFIINSQMATHSHVNAGA
jgi:hypothetical protein